MNIDSHQHFWQYNPIDYAWIGPLDHAIRRDFLPADLFPELQNTGIDATIAVQASPTLAETDWLLTLSAHNHWIRAVVGWVDLGSPLAREQIERFSENPRFRGVRHPIPVQSQDTSTIQSDFLRGIAALGDFGRTFDILISPDQIPTACDLVARFPYQRFVLDHLANPPVKEKIFAPWSEDMRRLSRYPNVACKVSGLVTKADWRAWQAGDFSPYLDLVLECFGPERLMFGSDWPVCRLAATYRQVHAIIADYFHRLSPAEKEKIWGGTAEEFYGLK